MALDAVSKSSISLLFGALGVASFSTAVFGRRDMAGRGALVLFSIREEAKTSKGIREL